MGTAHHCDLVALLLRTTSIRHLSSSGLTIAHGTCGKLGALRTRHRGRRTAALNRTGRLLLGPLPGGLIPTGLHLGEVWRARTLEALALLAIRKDLRLARGGTCSLGGAPGCGVRGRLVAVFLLNLLVFVGIVLRLGTS